MEILGKLSLWIHIVAGTLTLIAGPIAIFYNFKDIKKHKKAGKVFFYAMLVVCVTSFLALLKRPDALFFQFLVGIAVLVSSGVLRAVRAIRIMKGDGIRSQDYVFCSALVLLGGWMYYMAGSLFSKDINIAFPILFVVFGTMAFSDAWVNFRLIFRFDATTPMNWYRLHVGTMIGAFTASTTAFTVNAAPFLPWFIQWFGPTLALVPLQIYFGRKIRRKAVAA